MCSGVDWQAYILCHVWQDKLDSMWLQPPDQKPLDPFDKPVANAWTVQQRGQVVPKVKPATFHFLLVHVVNQCILISHHIQAYLTFSGIYCQYCWLNHVIITQCFARKWINTKITVVLQAEFPQHGAAVSGDKFGFRFSEDWGNTERWCMVHR